MELEDLVDHFSPDLESESDARPTIELLDTDTEHPDIDPLDHWPSGR